MGAQREELALVVEPERLVFRLRWGEIQRLNRARQTSASQWTAANRWRVYPLMLAIFTVYSFFNLGFGRPWLLGMLGLSIAAGVFLAFPGIFTTWARLPVLHWTIFDPISLVQRRTVDLDGAGMRIRGWRGDQSVPWKEIEQFECGASGVLVQNALRSWLLPARAFSSQARFDSYTALIRGKRTGIDDIATIARGGPARRFLALGDSYTIGEGVALDEGWPGQLTALLADEGLELAPPVIIAATGWTTEDLANGITGAHLAGTYDLVSLLIGVNNQYRGLPPERYREQFRGLLHQAIGLGGGHASRVMVLSIPDWGVTPFAEGRDRAMISREIDGFNAINREEAAHAGVHYVDIVTVSREAGANPALTAADGLHPSGVLYGRWARLALSAARTALSP